MKIRSYTGYGKGQLHIARVATLLQTSPQVFERLLAPGNLGREWGMLVLHIQDAGESTLRIRVEKNSRGQGREGSHSTRFLVARTTIVIFCWQGHVRTISTSTDLADFRGILLKGGTAYNRTDKVTG